MKKLNEEALQNELKASAFFKGDNIPTGDNPNHKVEQLKKNVKPATRIINTRETLDDGALESIRKEVKMFGKEAATHRFSKKEKEAITDLIYGFKKKNIQTSENEIARIAINFIIIDFKKNKNYSVLENILRLLNK